MGLLDSWRRVLRVAIKPSKRELWLLIRICFLAILIIGLISALVRLIAALFFGGLPG